MGKSKSHPCRHPAKAVVRADVEAPLSWASPALRCKKCGAIGIVLGVSNGGQEQNTDGVVEAGGESAPTDLPGDESAGVRSTAGILNTDDSGSSIAGGVD